MILKKVMIFHGVFIILINLSTKQQKVVKSAKKEIRKEVNKVGKANKAIEDYNKIQKSKNGS